MRKALSLFLLAAQILIVAGFWLWNHLHHPMGNQFTGSLAGQCLAWGRLAGLLAALGALLQLILIGRVKWVERAFGLDRLTRLHHSVGLTLIALLIVHAVLVVAGQIGQISQIDAKWQSQLLDFWRDWPGLRLAMVGLALLFAAAALSVAPVRRRLCYETWHATHLTLYVALALALRHQTAIGADFADHPFATAYWYGLYAFVFGNLAAYRVVRPICLHVRHRFTVVRLEAEAGDVTSVYIEGRNLASFRIEAGQFMIVCFLAPGFRWEAHPFSLSCPPDAKRLRLTIKSLGDFTRRIPQLPLGTRVLIDGPHGVFTARRCVRPKALLIAGGIGITPLRALADGLLAAGRDVVLIYGNRNASAVVFRKELDALADGSAGRLRVIYVMSDDTAWPGERGTVDRERIARLVPDAAERFVYLCGPPVMMRLVSHALRELGVPPRHILYERFAL